MAKNTTKTGNIGESVAAEYLERLGYAILDRNYKKKWGEIDIITQKGLEIQFVEVKTVSHETKGWLEWNVTHETWQPEEMVHDFKLKQLQRIVNTWVAENRYTGNYQLMIAAVNIVPRETYATVKLLEYENFQ